MKTLMIVTLAMALGGSCGTVPNQDVPRSDEGQSEPVTYRLLERGGYAQAASEEPGTRKESRVVVARTAERYQQLWSELIGSTAPPEVDFAEEAAVFLMLGQRSTGGYGIEPQSVRVAGNELTVEARVISPGKGDIVTQAFTAPFAVIAVNRPKLEAVRWQSVDGELMARSDVVK